MGTICHCVMHITNVVVQLLYSKKNNNLFPYCVLLLLPGHDSEMHPSFSVCSVPKKVIHPSVRSSSKHLSRSERSLPPHGHFKRCVLSTLTQVCPGSTWTSPLPPPFTSKAEPDFHLEETHFVFSPSAENQNVSTVFLTIVFPQFACVNNLRHMNTSTWLCKSSPKWFSSVVGSSFQALNLLFIHL